MKPLPQQLLPDSMQEIAEIIGLPDTLLLIEQLGGTRLCVPADISHTRCWLYGKISHAGWVAIIKRSAGAVIEIPRCTHAIRHLRDLVIAADLDSDMGTRDVALKYGMTERNVRYIKQRLADGGTQQDFFDE